MEIIEEFSQSANQAFDALEQNFTPDESGMHYLLDCMIDLALEHPEAVNVFQRAASSRV